MRQRRPPGFKPGNLGVVRNRAVTERGGARRGAGCGINMNIFKFSSCLCVRASYILNFF